MNAHAWWVATVLFLALTPLAAAKTYVVNQRHPAAADHNSGTEEKPFATITAASRLVKPGGEPIWWCESWGFGASPAYGRGLIYADKGGNEGAVAIDPTGQSDVSETHVKWQIDKLAGDYSSPVISGNHIYRVQAEGVITCLELSTGKKVYTGRLDKVSKLASPIATADGRIYLVSTGQSYVIKAGPRLEILGHGNLGGWGNGSSAAVSGGRIFVRDFEFLYCLGKGR